MVNHLVRSVLTLNSVILGGQSSLTMCRLNLNLKILGEILVSDTGGSIIFDHVQTKSELKDFR